MAYRDLRSVLFDLLKARSSAEVRQVLTALGDSPDLGLDSPFGPLGLMWHAFGDNLSNVSTIGLGTKPGRSLTERITNAFDAILEDRAAISPVRPNSPRLAAEQWFGRPVSGAEDGLFKWNYTGIDRRIAVVLQDSGVETAPTVDVVDDGIGILPDQFPTTILSLQQGNKITKWYLIGAFGQGGAATLAFCDFALVVSRHRDNARVAGFTVIKNLRLDETYKEDTYAYLAVRAGTTLSVPSIDVGAAPVSIYPKESKAPELAKGTLVRHFTYKLSNLERTLSPSPGNLYHFLHVSLFDPLFPFRLIDLRDPSRAKDELVTGSRNRLMKLVQKKAADSDAEDGKSEIKHHRAMEFVVPHGAQEPSIGIEYWVVFNYRKGKTGRRDDLVLRPSSNELFVQHNHPIVGTLNGQNQGELTGHMLRELGLGMVARHLVVHVDGTNVDRITRRELFATNREGFKEGPVLTDLTRVLRRMIEEDENLLALERELTERIARREAQATSEEVKKQVTKLLIEAGFQPQTEGKASAVGIADERQLVRVLKAGKPVQFEPLPTLAFPDVTRFELVTPRPKMEIRLNDIQVVLVETDADAEYDRQGRVAIRTEPESLELVSKTPLRGGRVRWRLRPRAGTNVGQLGHVIVTLTKPDGSQLTDSTPFEVLAAAEEKAKTIHTQIPPFEIYPINPTDNPEQWETVWERLPVDSPVEELSKVAYKAVKASGVVNVYYSTIFTPFRLQIEKLSSESQAVAQLFQTNYAVWVGYHAILQEGATLKGNGEIDSEVFDKLMEEDRIRVAQMQVKQALQTAELMRKAMRDQAAVASQ